MENNCNDSNNVELQSGGTTPVHNQSKKNWTFILPIAVLLIGYLIIYIPRLSTSWTVDEACNEVKSKVYNEYGVIPQVSGELIYKDRPNYIVVVRYEIPEWDYKASRACVVFGFRKNSGFVKGMTSEMSYNFDYEANLDEIKALWSLN